MAETGKKLTKDDIIRMAREAELIYWHPNSTFSGGFWWMDAGEPGDGLERFAALVAATEREACAAICDRFQARDAGMQPAECAGAIRARGQQ